MPSAWVPSSQGCYQATGSQSLRIWDTVARPHTGWAASEARALLLPEPPASQRESPGLIPWG